MRKIAAVLLAGALGLSVTAAMAGDISSRQAKVELIEALNGTLGRNYVFPDKAETIAAALRDKVQRGGYDSVHSEAEMAGALTDDLIRISGDLHFSVGVDAGWVADYRTKDAPGREAARQAEAAVQDAKTNFGFRSAGILDGNIGYINLSYFADPVTAYDTAAAAMRMVENSDAVIIDLRYNNGGHLEMAQFIASYFFSGESDKLLFDYYYNDDGRRIARGQWVLPALPGKRMVDKPVYILSGSTTFSAGEWFSYTMQKLGRARIIGAQTAGGAHPVDRKPVNDDFFVQVPIGQIRDPVDNGDFEGVGVTPDIAVPSIDALPVAHRLALEVRSKGSADDLADYQWRLPSLTGASMDLKTMTSATMSAAVGAYEGRRIAMDHGRLYYIWRSRLRAALTPVGPDLFDIEGVEDFRYRLVFDGKRVTGLERINRDGTRRMYRRIDG